MQTTMRRHLPIAGTFNIRDLGGYPHAGGETRWRRILRADGLHRMDARGVAELADTGVTTVIDLRHDHELESQPNPFRDHPSIAYRHISLFDQLAPAAMGDTDMLQSLYVQALTQRGGAIAEVLTTIADAPPGIVLFHCTAGKDRTGLISALVLAVAGVETALILDDYALTKVHIEPLLAEIIADAVARGADAESFRLLLGCEPETMGATLAHLIAAHGSIEAYLSHIGLDDKTIERLNSRLAEGV